VIYIYTHITSTRLQYTLEVLLTRLLQVPYKIVTKEEFLIEQQYPKINYSNKVLPDSIWIKPHALLFQKNIVYQDIAVTHKTAGPYFFKTSDQADFNFDILASSFYMLSRYEEYLPFKEDTHRRFAAEQSLAYKANFIQKPVVNIWANQLRDAIISKYPKYPFTKRVYTQHNSIDIDYAYDIKGKPLSRRLAASLYALFTLNFTDLKKRFLYCFTSKKDLFDVYDELFKLQEESKVKTTYFFQVGKYAKFDKNLPLKRTLKDLILRVANYADIGLHPSYSSNTNFTALKEEQQNLSKVLHKPITKSRQHFLKLSFPKTYEDLIKIGIKEDYSMGFSNALGFRAGVASPYPFFNLKTNTQRPLLLVPFQIMDVTLKDYLKFTPQQAIEKIKQIKKEIQKVEGEFISIFHNSSLADEGEWVGWLNVYKEILK